MRPSERTVFWFGLYLALLGAVLMAAPGALFAAFNLPAPPEPWMRLLGAAVAALGWFYTHAARQHLSWFVEGSVSARCAVMALITILILTPWVPTALLLFGLVDLAGALWTRASLRREAA